MPVVIQDRTSLLLRRPPRTHPYAGVGHGAPGRYYDFKLQPDLIETVLEDFASHSGEAGVQRFFTLLRHVNRPNAPFETTDCGLTQTLYRSKNSPFPDKLGWVGGRLMLMYRKLDQNCQPESVRRLVERLRAGLRRAGRRYTHVGFVIGPFPTLFCTTGQRGSQIDIEFAMWGDSFEEGMHRFSDVVGIMEQAVKECEKMITLPNIDFADQRRCSKGSESLDE